ncbi:MAG: hypothetical protein OXH68_11870 [Gammaproteobacteria bacterium]|nr:hypothetical protein [Gammaproteobacteria bacterium]
MRRFLKANAATLGAVGGYVIAVGVAFTSIGVLDAERSASAMSRYGIAVAEDLAFHAVEPLLRRDRIQLGLLTNRLASRPEVRLITIRTADERLFVVAGRATTETAQGYNRPVMVEDTVAGDVTVTLNPESFVLSVTDMLSQSWQFVLAGLAAAIFLSHFGSRLGSSQTTAPGSNRVSRDVPPPAFVVVANLPLRSASQSTERERLLARGMAVGRRIANLYAGHSAALPGSGVVVVFPVSGSTDRCFEVVCAALLMRRLLSEKETPVTDGDGAAPDDVSDDAPGAFRYGIDFCEAGPVIHGDTVKPSAVSNVVLLASLAGARELVLGQAAYETLDRPDRVELEQLRNPATEALSSGVAMPCGKIQRVARDYDALIARQAEVIAIASDRNARTI